VVGTSARSYRAHNVGELIDLDAQKNALPLFRSGKINLVIATNVLEEGIDIPACNVVVCFQKPANLKSFVQRRGRARQRLSELILLLDSTDNKVVDWRQLEADMRSMYENEMRILQEILVREDEEIPIGMTFRVESTGAVLDLDNAIPHLYHFCATLPVMEYVDLRPEFICSEVDSTFIRAKVILPLSVDEAVRTSESQQQWKSEKNAIKDAAFQAYLALYRARLVNDNLLPLLRYDSIADELAKSAVETRASIVTVKEQLNPWIDIAKSWKVVDDTNSGVHSSIVTIDSLDTMIHLPVPIPIVPPFRIFWDSTTEFLVTPRERSISLGTPSTAKSDTLALLQVAFGHRFSISQAKAVMQFSVNHDCRLTLSGRMGHRSAEEALLTLGGFSDSLVRDKINMHIAYTLKELLARKPSREQVQNPYIGYDDTPQDSAHLSLTRVPRRLDFLHRTLPSSSQKPYSIVLPVSRCTVDDIPFKLIQLGLFIPSIMHRYEVYLVAEKLSTTLLAEVQISNLSLVVTAISASSAREDTNYQKLEFLGDSILKMCTSVQLMAEYPLWHEGYLSAKKDRLIANSRLSRSAIESGLDEFIITKAFTGLKWRPLYVDDLLKATGDSKRDMSTKVLADVVEALIGAAMVDGDIPKALACLQVFLPELSWQPLAKRRSFLYQRVPDIELPATLQPVESLIGYRFKKPGLLIEAMTHASNITGSGSLERLEFLGDSILDNIMVTAMYPHDLSHVQMHLLRTALVNADFLAFICMEWSIEQEVIDLEGEGLPQIKVTSKSLPLWRFMRHMSPKIGLLQVATLEKYTELREHIKAAVENGTHYPWALLARLEAHKFYSDLIESLLGAAVGIKIS
jgi:dsRNA-specific ribonuclease